MLTRCSVDHIYEQDQPLCLLRNCPSSHPGTISRTTREETALTPHATTSSIGSLASARWAIKYIDILRVRMIRGILVVCLLFLFVVFIFFYVYVLSSVADSYFVQLY